MRATAGLAVIAACAALALPARAADLPELTDPVVGHPGVTYLDLLKQVVPDLAANADNKDIEGHFTRQPRHLAGKTYEGDPPDPVVAQSFLEVRQIRVSGKRRLVLLEDLGADPDRAYDTALLALYDDEAATPKLLDAVDVGVDRDTGFADSSPLTIAYGETALVTLSEHGNTSQSYDPHLLILVRRDRFELIDQLFLISDRNCGYERGETAVFSTRPDPGRRYAEIVASVSETLKRNDDDCGDAHVPRSYAKVWRTVWRWNPKRGAYVDISHGLDGLDKRNEPRL